MSNYKVGFIGGGNMARAIVAGLRQSRFPADHILVSEPSAAQRDVLADEFDGSLISADNRAVLEASDAIVLATKPQVLPEVCRELADAVQSRRPLVISIAAGIRSRDIDGWLGGDLAVVRVMPNQPALVRMGVSGMFANDKAHAEDVARATEILSAVGSVVIVENESDIDTVTAVSGTGPAYVYLLIDMMIQSGIHLGLDADAAERMAIETARGASHLAAEASESMAELIERVRSPGGTTTAAFESLEADDVRAIFSRAITAARDRAVQLADDAAGRRN
jgi:pyrroline-5-carboxylate reductase